MFVLNFETLNKLESKLLQNWHSFSSNAPLWSESFSFPMWRGWVKIEEKISFGRGVGVEIIKYQKWSTVSVVRHLFSDKANSNGVIWSSTTFYEELYNSPSTTVHQRSPPKRHFPRNIQSFDKTRGNSLFCASSLMFKEKILSSQTFQIKKKSYGF